MHSVHGSLSITATIPDGNETKIAEILAQWDKDVDHSFFRNCSTILCASAVIVREQFYGEERLPPSLLLITTFVGPLSKHVDELMNFGEEDLRSLFQYTEDFTIEEQNYRNVFKQFLLKRKTLDAFYTGIHHIRPIDIQREFRLKNRIQAIVRSLAENHKYRDKNATGIKADILNEIAKDAQFSWLKEENVRTGFIDWWLTDGVAVRWIAGILFLLLAFSYGVFRLLKYVYNWDSLTFMQVLVTALTTLLIIAIPLSIGRFLEWKEPDLVAARPDDEELQAIAATQSHPVINELTAAGPVKPGGFRKFVYWVILNIGLRIQYKPFIATVVAARWIGLNNCKRLVFVSNFANTAEFYVRDFIDSKGSAMGINFLFGHGQEYPKTRFLRLDGAMKDPEAFLNVFLKNQHITDFWYCPYKNFSVDNILINRKIRLGLKASLPEAEARGWLRLL